MDPLDDMALLREYAARASEAAFETLVSRRLNFVYSAALRQVRDPQLAAEITQAVFIILARKAGRISDRTILSGWLFKTTRFAARAELRNAALRRKREQEAQMQSEIQSPTPNPLWEQMSPLLDEALAALGETDRQAVLLRLFENKSLAEVGARLGTGEDTARKRIGPRAGKVAPLFFQAWLGLDHRCHRRGDFCQFRPCRAHGAGKNHDRRGGCERRGGWYCNFKPQQRSIETYGMDQGQDGDCRRGGYFVRGWGGHHYGERD
jgi:RNA polymerase sigma factor (sigma-70 family)